jgi:hypothetical protein
VSAHNLGGLASSSGVRMKLGHRYLRDGEPCGHHGCLIHVTHPCEGCGRVGGRFALSDKYLPTCGKCHKTVDEHYQDKRGRLWCIGKLNESFDPIPIYYPKECEWGGIMNGVELIESERKRQIEEEKWVPEHDDEHRNGELIGASRAYSWASLCNVRLGANANDLRMVPNDWPIYWDRSWWKPSDDPIRNLVKAGALIAAEIDRLQRAKDNNK